MNESMFQNIYDELADFVPADFEKLVIYLEYGEASYSFAFYVKCEGKYTKCYDILGIDEDKLMIAYKNIDVVVNQERKAMGEPWSNMTMVVDADGHMHTDFDYTDLTENSYQYMKDWMAKYLI